MTKENPVPELAIDVIREVVRANSKKYPDGRWQDMSITYHLKHALDHLELFKNGDMTEPHLEHALCRTAMAVQLAVIGRGGSLIPGCFTDYGESVHAGIK